MFPIESLWISWLTRKLHKSVICRQTETLVVLLGSWQCLLYSPINHYLHCTDCNSTCSCPKFLHWIQRPTQIPRKQESCTSLQQQQHWLIKTLGLRKERDDEGREVQISAGTSAIQKPPSLLCSRSSPYETPDIRSPPHGIINNSLRFIQK